mmetsp:Transcript_35448/g.77948  ORF Transcript_35448/g.77948 Transcript_35448/m.77948 type:complete len:259 (-) Transcript_35448:810-1586(-)
MDSTHLREWVSRPAAAAASGGVSSCTRGARRACTELSSVAAENAAEASLAAVSAVAAGCGCASSAERSEGAQVLSVWPSDAGEVPPRVSGINTSTPDTRQRVVSFGFSAGTAKSASADRRRFGGRPDSLETKSVARRFCPAASSSASSLLRSLPSSAAAVAAAATAAALQPCNPPKRPPSKLSPPSLAREPLPPPSWLSPAAVAPLCLRNATTLARGPRGEWSSTCSQRSRERSTRMFCSASTRTGLPFSWSKQGMAH